MKTILALSLLVLLASCGKKTDYEGRNTSGGNGNPTGGGTLTTTVVSEIVLNAVKSYSPVSYVDDAFNLTGTYKVTIPAYITVISGNAGNWNAEIHIDSDLVCIYKGGSSMTNPLYSTDTVARDNGKKYLFSHCISSSSTNTGNQIGDKVYAQDHITLAIKNGDSQAQTKAQVSITIEQ